MVSEPSKAHSFFCEYNSMCYYIASLLCVPLLLVITPFISVFYGPTYALPFLGSLCVVIILFFKIIEIPFDVYYSALGYFDKVRNCVIFQSIVNLILSIILLFKLGISGVLLATVISYIVGEFFMYPRILNKNYFKNNKIKYYSKSFKLVLISLINYLVLYFITKNVVVTNLFSWFIFGMICFIINTIITTIYYIIIKETSFFERFKTLLNERRKKNA